MPDTRGLWIATAVIIVLGTIDYSTASSERGPASTIIAETTTATTTTTTTSTTTTTLQSIQENEEPPKIVEGNERECPNITGPGIETCNCDFPHTLKCSGNTNALKIINEHLRHVRPGIISLLDLSVTGISTLPANFLEDIALHGLVVSTGELRRVHESAFTSLKRPLSALGLPRNLLDTVPTLALANIVGLERLDLSNNKLKTLEATSFKGLTNLTYLDLSGNLLSQMSPQAFASIPGLKLLKMKGNRLSVSALSALRGLRNLEELDISANLLSGPLGRDLVPPMPRLRTLNVANNELRYVKKGALMGLKNLSSLILNHNQIDVLEDHAFEHLSSLTHLELATNGIVAVSSSSLAHLENLKSLDLTHNFLRSLNGDLVIPLSNLEILRLDDNDITMVTSDFPTSKLVKLKSLSLADNPLNCDCSLLEFANWLSNSKLEPVDKMSAVCATPPTLVNGILTQISPGSLLCGDPTPPVMTNLPLAAAQLTLHEFHYDEATGVDLLWQVEPCTERYTCDTLIVYESVADKQEVQIASSPIHCDSRLMRNPCSLPITLPTNLRLQAGHKYRYCVVLMVPAGYEEVSLGLGCSDILELDETLHVMPDREDQRRVVPEISDVHVNVSHDGFLKVEIAMSSSSRPDCEIDLDVFAAESGQVHRKRFNCSMATTTLTGLVPGHYRVCASVQDDLDEDKSTSSSRTEHESKARCVEVQTFKQSNETVLLLLLLGATFCFLVIVVFLISKSLLGKSPKELPSPPQCFMPAQEVEITHKAHYIKLHATTKV